MDITPTRLLLVPPTQPSTRALSRALAIVGGGIKRSWGDFVASARRSPKLLLVTESSALGDRRFVAVVQFERQRFLIGSSPSSVTLLARLSDADRAMDSGADATTSGETTPGATTPVGAKQ